MLGLDFGEGGVAFVEGAGGEEEVVIRGGLGDGDDGFETDAAVGACFAGLVWQSSKRGQ